MPLKDRIASFESMKESDQRLSSNKQRESKCYDHPNEPLRMYCTKCDTLICYDCITGEHEMHKKVKLDDIFQDKKREFLEEMSKCQNMLSSLEVVDNDLQNNIRSYTEDVNQLKTHIKERNETLKHELDQITENMINQLEQKAKEDKNIMAELRKVNQNDIRNIKEITESIDEKMRGKSNIEIMRYITAKKTLMDKFRTKDYAKMPSIQPPSLCVNSDDVNIQGLIGYLKENETESLYEESITGSDYDESFQNDQLEQTNTSHFTSSQVATDSSSLDKDARVAVQRRKGLFIKDVHTNRATLRHQENIDITIESSFTLENNAQTVSGASNSTAWFFVQETEIGEKVNLSQVSDKGKVKKEFRTEFTIYDIAITPFGDLLATDDGGGHVIKIRPGKVQKLFGDVFKNIANFCPYHTRGIEVAVDSTILVCLSDERSNKHKVVKLWPNGELKTEIQYDNCSNKPLFSGPKRIKQGPFCDIYIMQENDVVALHPYGAVTFTYTGPIKGEKNNFRPIDIETEKNGYILISDATSSSLHVLDHDGTLLKLIYQIIGPNTMSMDQKGRLWICCKESFGTKVLIAKFV